MPQIVITPGKRNPRNIHTSEAGAAIGSAFGPIGTNVGASIGAGLQKLLGKRKPAYPIQVDTDSNIVQLLAPTVTKAVRGKLPALAKSVTSQNAAVQSALQEAWNTGTMPTALPKRYRAAAEELLTQRGMFYTSPDPPPAIVEGAQYGASMITVVPPGGFAGYAGMTPASKFSLRIPKGFSVKRKRKKKAATGGKRRKKRASGKKPKRLVKGSAAAKRYMAKIRRKRG